MVCINADHVVVGLVRKYLNTSQHIVLEVEDVAVEVSLYLVGYAPEIKDYMMVYTVNKYIVVLC